MPSRRPAEKDTETLVLEVNGAELPVVKAAVAEAIDVSGEMHLREDEVERLRVLLDEARQLMGHGPYRLHMTRADAAVVHASVTAMMAAQGYVVGRPQAVAAMTAVRRKLDRLLKGSKWDEVRQATGEILYGMFVHDSARMFRRQESSLEHLFVLISFGDMLGVPILPPYYSLRLLPFVTPLINGWRRRMLREKDLIDALF